MSLNMNIIDADFAIEAPLALPEDEVHVWRVDLDALRAGESRWQETLSYGEMARASRFRSPHDRQRFAASRALLRIILAGYLATDPSHLNFAYSSREKPFLGPAHAESGVAFNISHSGGIAMLAFTRRREIGVDVEQVRRDFDVEEIAHRFFSRHEQLAIAALPMEKRFAAFFRCWTRKEAYIKATGEGLSLPLHQFDVSIAAEDGDALVSTRPDSAEAAHWSLREMPAGPGFVAALCVRGHDWHLRDWSASAEQ
jgi:4'-phosphopantetheinyl transferase